MPPKIKAVAIDIDGTLVSPEQDVTPRVKRAVAQARERGVIVMLATGRRFDSAQEFAQALDLDGPMIVSGGAMVCNAASGEIYYEDVLPQDGVAAAVDLLHGGGLQPLLRERWSLGHRLFTGPHQCDDEPARIYVSREEFVIRLPYERLRETPDVMFAAGLCQDEDRLQTLAKEVWKIPNLLPLVLPYGPGVLPSPVLDIFNAGTCKAKALHFISKRFGFDMAHTMAIGDGINDVDLLQAVGMPVAVANAIPEAKAVAKAVVSSNDEDGVAEAIEWFVLDRRPHLSI
ncbi:MAG TPA: HAD family hydrolase [Chloroflexota bacterium]|nr:HAD family hydrolase [Chloroflexota bacterium]